MKGLRLILIWTWGTVASIAHGDEPPLGRLFFTPERRAQMDQQRRLNIQETQTLEGASITLNGMVIRSSGKRTVWINDRAQNDNQTPQGVTVNTHRRAPGQASLNLQGEVTTDLKVGETVNRATQETSGRIDVGRSARTTQRP